jgi:hypothetical protein
MVFLLAEVGKRKSNPAVRLGRGTREAGAGWKAGTGIPNRPPKKFLPIILHSKKESTFRLLFSRDVQNQVKRRRSKRNLFPKLRDSPSGRRSDDP